MNKKAFNAVLRIVGIIALIVYTYFFIWDKDIVKLMKFIIIIGVGVLLVYLYSKLWNRDKKSKK